MDAATSTKTKPNYARPSLGAMIGMDQARSSAALLKRLMPDDGGKGVKISAFGSAI